MKRFTNAGRKAIEDGNLYAALSLALTVPDICGSLETPGPGKTQTRYEKWYKKWVEPKFTSSSTSVMPSRISVSAADCFQLRCSLIHSGSAEIAANKQDILCKFEFFDQSAGAHLNWVEGLTMNGVRQPNFLQLKADLFSLEMFEAADEWDAAMANNAAIQKEKAKLLRIRTKGEVISGMMFG